MEDAYSLKGGAQEPPNQPTGLQAATPTYELGGLGSGTRRPSQSILTAALPERVAPIPTASGIWFYPSVITGIGFNDNVLGSADNPLGSHVRTVSPDLIAEMKNGGDRYTAKLGANTAEYAQSRNDDYANYEVRVAGDNFFSHRARMGWSIAQTTGSDPRAASLRAISSRPDHWTMPEVAGKFIYGAQGAQGRIELDANYQSKRYDNNRDTTAVADFDRKDLAGRFFVRVGSRSMALIEVRNAVDTYKSELSPDSNTERRYYLGMTWDASAATTGIFKVGRMTKDFVQAGRQEASSSSWEGKLRWLPRTYSVFNLGLSKEITDSTGLGDYTLNTGTDLSWNHKWSYRVRSIVSAAALKSEYANTARIDNTKNFSAKLTYDIARWATIGVDYARTNRLSSDPTSSFRRNIFMLTLNATL